MAAGISVASARSGARPAGGAGGAAAATAACSEARISIGPPASAMISAQRADVALQQPPGLGAEFLLPLGIEAGLAQRRAEQLGIGGVEHHALLGELALQGVVELADVVAVFEPRGVGVFGDGR